MLTRAFHRHLKGRPGRLIPPGGARPGFRLVLVGLATLLLVGGMVLSSTLVKPTRAAGALTSQGILAYAKLSDGSLGILNLGTGTFTQFPNSGVQLVGLGEFAGTLFADTFTNGGTLYRVNPQNGTLTAVGSANINFALFGSTTNGLFGLDYSNNLYSINPATGAATLLGPTGLTPPAHGGLSSGSSTLYLFQAFGTTPTPASVYTLNTTTGAATLIGNSPGVFGPMVIGGTLYAESWISCTTNPSGICAQSIYSFDPTTGNSTFVSKVNTPLQAISDGLAPVLNPSWTQLLPGGPLPAPRDDSSAVYDSANNTLVLFGGNATGCTFSPSLNDTWLLSNANGLGASPPQWTQIFPSGLLPGVRRGQTAVYDPATDRMIVFGGDPVGCAVTKYNDTWVLVNASGAHGPPSWVQLSPAGSLPPARSDHSAVYDQAHNRMIIAGGYGPAGNLNDVWVLTNANGLGGTPTWMQLSPAGGPPSATGLRAVAYDPTSNTMIVFGGTNCCNYVYYNETWLLTNANGLGGTPQWINLTPSGTAPSARAGASAVYDAPTNTMTIFGGGGSGGHTNETWALTNANGLGGTPMWSQLSPSGTLPAPRGGITADPAMGYDAVQGRMIIFGGNTPSGLANDTWVLSGLPLGGTFTLSPSAVNLVTTPGTSPSSQSVTLTDTGLGTLNWLSNSLPSWVSVSPTSGSLTPGASQPLTLSFNTPSTTPQTYSTNLVLTDPNATNSPFSVPITVVSANVSKTWYFAEGTTMNGFSEFLTLANPNNTAATVTVQYLLGSGSPVMKQYTVTANQRATVNVGDPMQGVGPGQAVSMVVSSDLPIIAERPMYFSFFGIPGGSDVLGATQLATSFDFGYLDTTANYSTFLTVLNQDAGPTPMTVTIHYFAQNGTMTTATHMVAHNSRGTVTVSGDVSPGIYSALVTLSLPGLVERPMYLIDRTTGYTGSSDVVGVATPLTDWYFAEGYNNQTTFDERYIVSNPTTGGGTVTGLITFFLSNGTTQMTPFSLGPGQQQILDAGLVLGANTPNSAHVSASAPILAERFQSFNFGGDQGASDVLGTAKPTNLFYFAEGTTQSGFAEYLTIQNPNTSTAYVSVTFLPANGNPPVVQQYLVAPSSRFTLDTSLVMGGHAFSLVVEANVAIVAERPMYFNFFGSTGGTDVVGYQP